VVFVISGDPALVEGNPFHMLYRRMARPEVGEGHMTVEAG
jgi:hypothetical protein